MEFKSTVTLTYCESGENHHGMEQIGKKLDKGLTLKDLQAIQSKIKKTQLLNLGELIEEDTPEAHILLIPNGVKYFGISNIDIYNELMSLTWDRKYWDTRRGKVLNKHARANLCFDEKSSKADYENKKGTIVGYDEVKNVKLLKDNIESITKLENLVCEGNLYDDPELNGIGWHGDSERRVVIAARIGLPMFLKFQWYYKGKPVGKICEIKLKDGDMYIMSEKAVGTDWKKRNIYTLRHSAGGAKYTKPKSL